MIHQEDPEDPEINSNPVKRRFVLNAWADLARLSSRLLRSESTSEAQPDA